MSSIAFPLLMMWGGIAILWLSIGAGHYFDRRRIEGVSKPNWFMRHETLTGAILTTVVAALGAYTAWIAAQSQIDMSKKQHRLEYLRQYLAQLDPSTAWLMKAERSDLRVDPLTWDTSQYEQQKIKDLDDKVAFLNAMPMMPYYKGERPVERREKVLDAIRNYRFELQRPKDETGRQGDVDKAKEDLQKVDRWYDDYQRVNEISNAARRELEGLEKEAEDHSQAPPF